MARSTPAPADPTRRAAFVSGLFYLITFASSIPAYLMLTPVLTDPGYITGSGPEGQVLLACLLDLVNALTAVGSAVAVFSVLKRFHESMALGFVTTRMFEAATIVVGIVALLAVVSIRQAGPAAGTDDAALVAVGQGLVGVRDWTFIIGPSLMPGFNALLFATVLYRARLVPRLIPAMGLVGGPLLILSTTGIILGYNELGSGFSVLATMPIFAWELAVGLWMTFKGFNRNVTVQPAGAVAGPAGARRATPGTGVAQAPGAAAMEAPGAAVAQASVRFAPLARIARFHLRPRHLMVLLGLWLAFVASGEAKEHGVGLAVILAFSIAPRLPLLLGVGQPKGSGRIARRSVPLFNFAHEPLVPAGIVALGAAGIVPAALLVGALAWLAQVVIDWGLGDGLREADGSLRATPARWTSWPGRDRTGAQAATS